MKFSEISLAGTREFGLIEEYEKLEQQKLRAAYIETMRNHIRTHLDNVVIQRPDGSREKLKKKI